MEGKEKTKKGEHSIAIKWYDTNGKLYEKTFTIIVS